MMCRIRMSIFFHGNMITLGSCFQDKIVKNIMVKSENKLKLDTLFSNWAPDETHCDQRLLYFNKLGLAQPYFN